MKGSRNGGTAVLLRVRVTPGVRSGEGVTRVSSEDVDSSGRGAPTQLAVRVAGRAIDGAANSETLAAVARALRVPPSSVTLSAGAASRDKVLAVHGREPSAVAAAVASLPLT